MNTRKRDPARVASEGVAPCTSARGLMGDQRGAVLLIGLFMALSLIGSLWFIVGMGDAVVFHDHGQEAADAAALSASTINARGMNLIAAINIIMLMLATVYIFACLIADFLAGVSIALWALAVPTVGATVGPAEACDDASEAIYEFAESYQEGIMPVMEGLGVAGAAVAMSVPWMGTVAALDAGAKYNDHGEGYTGLAFGGSNIPGFAITGGFSFHNEGGSGTSAGSTNVGVQGLAGERSNFSNLRGADTTLGLPVAFEANQALCARSVIMVLDFFKSFMQGIPVIGWVLSLPFIDRVLHTVIDSIGVISMYAHCSGGFWEQNGPKKMTSENGGPGMQEWGLAMGGALHDDNDRHVKMSEGPPGLGGGGQDESATYFSQSEFFYDCEDNWTDDACNGDYLTWISNYKLNHAVYSIDWKARVTRMQDPLQAGLSLLSERFTNALTSNSFTNFFLNVPGIRNVTRKLNSLGGKLGEKVGLPGTPGPQGARPGNAVNSSGGQAVDNAISRAIYMGGDALNNALQPNQTGMPGVYH